VSSITYKSSGVDIEEGDRFVERIAPLVKRTFRPEVLTGIGSFGALFGLDTSKYREPVLVSGTDGVGTKLKLAFMTGIHDTVGIDLVAMCVNDILTSGAEPLFFLDYFATGRLKSEDAAKVIEGIVKGCELAGCSLVGGETAEMPGFYPDGEYDLSGFAVGVVDKGKIIDGSTVTKGDAVIGVASSGIHSNGFSLVRKVLLEKAGLKPGQKVDELGCTLGEELLKPTDIYVKGVMDILSEAIPVKAMAHITGGGIGGNLPRALPKGVRAVIERKSWEVPPVFGLIQRLGEVPDEDMWRTFNMGLGYIIVTSSENTNKVLDIFRRNGYHSMRIGSIDTGGEGVAYA
jgi:phosphoribosylformylglycinamidine cyclo-ligase